MISEFLTYYFFLDMNYILNVFISLKQFQLCTFVNSGTFQISIIVFENNYLNISFSLFVHTLKYLKNHHIKSGNFAALEKEKELILSQISIITLDNEKK